MASSLSAVLEKYSVIDLIGQQYIYRKKLVTIIEQSIGNDGIPTFSVKDELGAITKNVKSHDLEYV